MAPRRTASGGKPRASVRRQRLDVDWGLIIGLIIGFGSLIITAAAWLWPQDPSTRDALPSTPASPPSAIARFDGRLETLAEANRFHRFVYDNFERTVYLRVEVTPDVLTANANPAELSVPRRIALRSDVCGSASLGQPLKVYDDCEDADIVYGVMPLGDDPRTVDLSWTGGGIGAWILRGFFRPVEANGPQMGTWYVELETLRREDVEIPARP